MDNHALPGSQELQAMARQFWNLWGDALRQTSATLAPAPVSGWQQALEAWSRLMPGTRGPMEELLHRFGQQSGGWYGSLQQVAAQFAGQQASATDVVAAWKKALGMDTDNGLWRDMFRDVQGGGVQSFEHWHRLISPYLDGLRREHERGLHLPAFGPAREHQQRWQALIQAQQDYQHALGEYEQIMLKVAGLAMQRFESLLAAHAQPGQQITRTRALFDLWIDAAEQAYAEVALSPDFRRVYTQLTNTQMRLRLGMQKEIEQVCLALGMPGRTELDSAHRKIADLERQVRQLTRNPQAQAPRQSAEAPAPQPRAQQAAAPRRAAARVPQVAEKSAAPVRSTAKAATGPAPGERVTAPRSSVRASRSSKAKPAPLPPSASKPARSAKPAKPVKPARTAQTSTTNKTLKAAPAKKAVKAVKAVKATGKKATRGSSASRQGGVVSMKDWVARNSTASAGGKTKRGQGGRK